MTSVFQYFANPKFKTAQPQLKSFSLLQGLPKSYKRTLEDCDAEINKCRCDRSSETLLMFCFCEDYLTHSKKYFKKISRKQSNDRFNKLVQYTQKNVIQNSSAQTLTNNVIISNTTAITTTIMSGQLEKPEDLTYMGIDVDETRLRQESSPRKLKFVKSNKSKNNRNSKKYQKQFKVVSFCRTFTVLIQTLFTEFTQKYSHFL